MTLGDLFAFYLLFAGAPPSTPFTLLSLDRAPFYSCARGAAGCTVKIETHFYIFLADTTLASSEKLHAVLAHEACHVALHGEMLGDGSWGLLNEKAVKVEEDRAWDCAKKSIEKMRERMKKR